MTPSDIATDVSTIQKFGSVNASVNGTSSYVGQSFTIDDWNSWD